REWRRGEGLATGLGIADVEKAMRNAVTEYLSHYHAERTDVPQFLSQGALTPTEILVLNRPASS
ncbi:hypothetical protein N9061_02765, partial [bacterium]|nr:hypothetical protein [bacterium]